MKVAWGGVVCALCTLGEEKMMVTKSNERDKGCRLPYRNAMRSCSGLDGRLPVPLTSGQGGFSAVHIQKVNCSSVDAHKTATLGFVEV